MIVHRTIFFITVHKNLWKKAAKTLLWVLIGLIVIVVSIPFLLYVPFIQDFARRIAVEKISESTGMSVDVSYLRLKFPLNLQVDSLSVVEASGDTMVSAGSAEVRVALWPLFRKEIQVNAVSLKDAYYRLGTPDSAMYLTARIRDLDAADTEIPLSFSRIALNKAVLDGADINLVMKDTVEETKPDTAAQKPLIIDVGSIELRDVRYRMSMLPVIDSLGAYIPLARLERGKMDMSRHSIDVRSLSVDSLSAAYLTPTAAYLKEHPAKPDSAIAEKASVPWTITAGKLRLTARDGLYAMRGAKPLPGFDASYISVRNVVVDVDSFYNRGTSIRVPLRRIAAEERCGLAMEASGVFSMDSLLMRADDFNVRTSASDLSFTAAMGIGDLLTDPDLPLELKATGSLSLLDARKFMPLLGQYMASVSPSAALSLNADIHGTASSLAVDRIGLDLPGYLTLKAVGRVDNPFDFKKMGGKIALDGTLGKVNSLKRVFLPPTLVSKLNIPPSAIKGSIVYSPGNIDGNVNVKTAAGQVQLDGKWNQKAEGYHADLRANRFPVAAFMPSLGVGHVTADVKIDGRGYNPASRATRMKASVDVKALELNGATLGKVKFHAALDTCRLTANVVSTNSFADFDADLAATFRNRGYQWDLSTDIYELDLMTMGLSKTPMHGRATLYSTGSYYPKSGDIDAELELNGVDWTADSLDISFPMLTAKLNSTDSLTEASLVSGDFNAALTAMTSMTDVVKRLTSASDILTWQINERKVNVDSLQRALPEMTLSADMGTENPVMKFLADNAKMKMNRASLEFANDSLLSVHFDADGFSTGSTRLDNISFYANQHGKYLVYKATINNNPGTMDDFAHVALNGFVADDKISAFFRQSNISGEQGFFFGVNASVSDSTVAVRLVPAKPTIAYKKWSINPDNLIAYNFVERHLDANLKVMSDSSSLHIYTEHPAVTDSLHRHDGYQEDVIVRLDNINLQEWLSISPFAPPIKGDVDADLRFRWDEKEITGNGTIDLNNLYYGRERVGTFNLAVNVANENRSRALHADVSLMVDGQEVITATGGLNDSTAVNPFLLDFTMIKFPLRVVNPFLPKDVAQLSGVLNGRMDVTGNIAAPVFNGFLDFDSTAVKVGMTGASYRFSEEKIPVDSNIVAFDDFSIFGLNDKPLRVNGRVDARHLTDIRYDLSMKAEGMQIVNSSRARGSAEVYGKAFIDVDATARGNLSYMAVDARLNVLPRTNVTYVVSDAQQALTSRSTDDMVKFVSFADTSKVAAADSLVMNSMAMILNADLTVSEGSTINVDLSTDGKNKVSIQGAGSLSYTLTPMNGAGRMTGRFTINSGFVRYTPALETGGVSMAIMSEKNFSFTEGSYIAFNGDLLNPTLSIRATDRLKANVTQSGQNSRLVNFDITVSVTNTLQNMNVAFDLSTDDDITIQNELASMSPEQRANQAMNMLLYNQYTGPGTKANANLSGNPLYSFLASQLNTWAANNIRGVDISFGIDQYDTTTDGSRSTTTSYSYRVSKTMFNDRFKIVVGGNYSTDADADENFSQNLINDISFEYMLNRSGSMYVRIFRHVGYESILEGEITQTGVGFVMKRKLNSLRDLFRFGRRPKEPAPARISPSTPLTVKKNENETDSIR